jgi:hypothetical protein
LGKDFAITAGAGEHGDAEAVLRVETIESEGDSEDSIVPKTEEGGLGGRFGEEAEAVVKSKAQGGEKPAQECRTEEGEEAFAGHGRNSRRIFWRTGRALAARVSLA